MDQASVCGRERPLEAEPGKTLDATGHGGNDLVPTVGTVSPHRAGRERIEPEADVAGGGIDAVALHIFRDMDRSHPRLRADLKLEADAGVEVNVLQHL